MTRHILAIGDSTTAGTPGFRSPLEAPPDGRGDERSQYAYWLMRAQPHWRVWNRGVNGERTDQIRERLTRDLDSVRWDAVVLIAGVNDIYQGLSAAAVIRELQAMYDTVGSKRVPLVAGTILPFNTATPDQNARMREVNDWIQAHADGRQAGVSFCDTRRAVSAPGDPDRLAASADELHPSAEGYRLMALALLPVILKATGR